MHDTIVVSFVAGAEIGDPEGTRTVSAIVALLIVLGIALVMLAIWMWRVTRPDPELLTPLEVMGERAWKRADPMGQRRRLDEVRPESAAPLKRPNAAPTIDESFDAGPGAFGVSDLSGYSVDGDDVLDGADAGEGDDGDDADVESDGISRAVDGTPVATRQPLVDDLDDLADLADRGDTRLDPELVARAEAELEREIGHDDAEL